MSDEGIRDWDLLDQYAHQGAQDAFAQLVKRYVDLVYVTCLRDLRDHHLAEDATQAVFLVLARKAASLRREVVLAGWLFQTSRLVVRNLRKQEARRKARERSAAEMIQQTLTPAPAWGGLSPLLSDGLGKLGSKDRNAVLLHYFQHKTLAEVGTATGVSEDAARMRISRAVEKLRSFFSRKGQTLAIGAVTTLLMASSIQAAPPTCTAAVVTAVCGSATHAALATGAAAALANATMKSLLFAKLKLLTAITALSLLVPAAGLATYHSIAARQERIRPIPVANEIVSEGEALGPAPAAALSAGKPVPVRSQPSSTNSVSRPKSPLVPQPSRSKPQAPPPDRIRFRVEGKLLTIAAPPAPTDGKPLRIVVPGLSGDTTILRQPANLRVENNRSSDGGELRTRIYYQPGGDLEIRRSMRPRNGKEYAVLFRQNQGKDPAIKRIGQVTVQVTSDGGENWTSWTAEDFPRFLESYPVPFLAHLSPIFRDFSARDIYSVPSTVIRKVLGEANASTLRPPLPDLLSDAEYNKGGLLLRRETEMLNRDVGFLLDCLESDALEVRTAALKQLSALSDKPVVFDVNGTAEKRKSMLNSLRHAIGAAKGS